MRHMCLLVSAAVALSAAAPAPPPPKLLAGFTRDENGLCHRKDGIYVQCEVAMPAATYECKDGSFSRQKILRQACVGRGGVRRAL